jgi:hypothetical protein
MSDLASLTPRLKGGRSDRSDRPLATRDQTAGRTEFASRRSRPMRPRPPATIAVRADSARGHHDEILAAEWPARLLDRAAVAEAAEVDSGEAKLIE